VVSEPVRVFIDSNQSKILGWCTRNRFGSSTLRLQELPDVE
jgi:hypothetical protein